MNAKPIKIVSSIVMVAGIVGMAAGSMVFTVLFFLGLFGFVAGRFAE